MNELTGLLAFIALCGVIGGGLWLSQRFYQRVDRARRVWEVVAKRLGGRFEGAALGFSGAADARVVARLDERTVTVAAERETLDARRPPTVATRVSAAATGVTGLRLRVAPEEGWAALGKLLGGHDLIVGDVPFDAAYVIEASNEDLARLWLSEPVRRRIERCMPYRIDLVDGEIRATFEGLETDGRRLETLARQVAALAGRGDEILSATRALASELEGVLSLRSERWALDGGALIVVERAGSRVLVDWPTRPVERGADRVVTRVRARAPDTPPLQFVLRARSDAPDAPEDLARLPAVEAGRGGVPEGFELATAAREEVAARISAPLWRRLEELSPLLVAGDGQEVSVLLGGVMLESAAVLRAVELASELAASELAGPYR